MKFFKRNSQKEYDGPAASAPNYRRHSTGDSGGNQSDGKQVPKSVVSTNGIVWSVASSISSERRASDHTSDASKEVVTKSKTTSGSCDSKSKSSHSRSHTSSHSSKMKIDRSIPLASGISSRRIHTPIEKHQSANKMSGHKHHTTAHATLHPISEGSNINNTTGKNNVTVCNVSSIPMHHDGGITCILPLPPSSTSSSSHNNNHCRFLSGGVDGIIQLWKIPQHESNYNRDIRDTNTKLYPHWTKLYKGHKGYIHQMARLGYFDPKNRIQDHQDGTTSFNSHSCGSDKEKKRQKELFVSASQDNTLRIWELTEDDSSSFDAYENSSVGNSSNGSVSTSSHSTIVNTKGLSSKGKKLRGHVFGGASSGGSVTSQGVLCVCSIPSLDPRGGIVFDRADQFVSGGSDGMVRVWDVRSALRLEKVPKSGLYSTVQIQCLEKDKISVLKDVDDESDGESVNEDGVAKRRSKKKSQADPITSIVCTGTTLQTVALFAADSSGTIRRYSPKNKNSIGHVNHSIWWEFTGYFTSGSTSVSSLAILSSRELSKLVYQDSSRRKNVTILASASAGCIRIWDGSDTLMKKKLDESNTQYSCIDRKKMKREALWKIQLNEDEESGDDEESSTAHPSTLAKNRISITSLSTCQGRRLIAGADDGKIHIWDVSSGEYEGCYEFGQGIQIWSLAVLSEVEYEAGDEIVNVSIIVSGDNRGRLHVLKNVSSRYYLEEEDFCKDHSRRSGHSRGGRSGPTLKEVDFG
ncbi:hypothetical protein ACHAWO_010458 [Cyclotella atomus]|uniref:Uncharacterized protein n=1 Tax=Cyclotella atomus TaxID=382360 RepID=A0ABD3MNW6_9STRA